MPFKNRIFLIILVIVVLALAAVLLAPTAVSNAVRLWVWWFARQEGFVATIDGVDAPFLRPIVIRQLHLKSVRDDAARVDITLLDARVLLNLKHIFLHLSGRDIRNIARIDKTCRLTAGGYSELSRIANRFEIERWLSEILHEPVGSKDRPGYG